MNKTIHSSGDKNVLIMLSIVLGWIVEMPLLRNICSHYNQMIFVIGSLALTLCMSMIIYRVLNFIPFSQGIENIHISPLLYATTSIVVLIGFVIGSITRYLTEYRDHIVGWEDYSTYWLSEATFYCFPIYILAFIVVLFLYKNAKEKQKDPPPPHTHKSFAMRFMELRSLFMDCFCMYQIYLEAIISI